MVSHARCINGAATVLRDADAASFGQCMPAQWPVALCSTQLALVRFPMLIRESRPLAWSRIRTSSPRRCGCPKASTPSLTPFMAFSEHCMPASGVHCCSRTPGQRLRTCRAAFRTTFVLRSCMAA